MRIRESSLTSRWLPCGRPGGHCTAVASCVRGLVLTTPSLSLLDHGSRFPRPSSSSRWRRRARQRRSPRVGIARSSATLRPLMQIIGEFAHWLGIVAKSSGQANAAVPDPPNFTQCVAAKRKTARQAGQGPAEGHRRPAQDPVPDGVQRAARPGRRPARHVPLGPGRGEGPQGDGHRRRRPEAFERRRSRASPRRPTTRSSSSSRARRRRTSCCAVKIDLLSEKIRDKVIKGKDNVTDAQLQSFYNKNKARFSTPETRDLRVVLTKNKAQAKQARAALEAASVEEGRQEVLDRPGLEGQGRQARQPGQGLAGEGARRRRLRGQEGQAHRPGQDPVRLVRLQGRRRSRRPSSRRSTRPRRRSSRRSRRRTSRRR